MTTLEALRNYLDKYDTDISNINLEHLKGLPFYSDWNNQQNVNCCDFNHAIGLPLKDGIPMPLFDYERMLFDTLQSNKHVSSIVNALAPTW